MEYTFETDYDLRGCSVMAKVLRKTLRVKRSRRSHFFGLLVIVLGVLLILRAETFDLRAVITLVSILVILLAMVFQDQLNGYLAHRHMLPGTEHASSRFTQDCFISVTEAGSSEFRYDKILSISETANHFVFLFSSSHAQIYDKRTLSGGTVEDFRAFIQEKPA